MEIEKLKAIPIKDYLSSLGFNPQRAKQDRPTTLYYFREWSGGQHLNFTVDTRLNLWYDHKLSRGGSIIDLVMYLHGCTAHKAMLELAGYAENNGVTMTVSKMPPIEERHDSTICIADDIDGRDLGGLYYYIRQRKISIRVIECFCKKITFSFDGRTFAYGLGFPKDTGGYVVRNKKAKINIGSVGISTLRFNDLPSWMVFEGFFDFLSFIEEYGPSQFNCIVLNSVANVERSFPILDTAQRIYTMMDNDDAGRAATLKFVERYGSMVEDKSYHYAPYKDYNEYLIEK